MGALVGFMTGCAATNGPEHRPASNHKAGVPPQQPTDDGAACLGESTWIPTRSA
jgi:hypothetical protein